MDWEAVASKAAEPPFIPRLENPYDTQYFASYADPAKVRQKMEERIKECEVDTAQPEEDESLFLNF